MCSHFHVINDFLVNFKNFCDEIIISAHIITTTPTLLLKKRGNGCYQLLLSPFSLSLSL